MATSINDEEFISLLNEGNVAAFEILFKLYRSKLLYIASQYVSNREDAEEIIQNVFLKVWSKKNIQSNINGYLYKVTRNACLDYLRSKKQLLNIENNLSQLEASINYTAFSDDATSLIIEKELFEAVLKSIELLPPKCKDVFVKSRIEGLNHKEISEKMDISKKTIETHITKALKHLRVSLREFLPFL
ncbi:RNA polymerase sigma-70 factor [Flavivirga spongiicola]|uniref:RNA polymerase sigma-70 factor n=1 Tax=Flavivirga spongiicola TaxID=421621 RepID=A0ABU7XPE5_9FLAO|nr:RNA polymerase sigma-70 factor [Flavivirga sp. MEBiC05379]MDO5977644.1 RNA polymerase sigma-70 factor [Flavivirga sp. MEBiC05379]